MLRTIAATLALALPATATLAQPASKPWPREVQAIYDGFKSQCRAGDGRFIPDKANFAHEVEVTNDGKPDWIVEISALDCHVTDAVRFSGEGPETGNAYCGTAGCQVTILGSTRGGLAEIFVGNIRSWEVVDTGGSKKGLLTSVHGSACGGVGAEVCEQTLRWNGRKWDMVKQYRWTEADYVKAQSEVVSADNAYVETARHETRWQVVGSGAGTMAVLLEHPEVNPIGLRCQTGGGVFMTVVPMPGTVLRTHNGPMLLDFYGSTEGIRATQTLTRDPAANEWSGTLVPPLQGLLSGRDTELMLLVSLDGGSEWTSLTYMSNGGSTAALRTLEKACAAAARTVASTQAGALQPVGPLGIVPGYYVSEYESCGNPGPSGAFFYDGRRFGLMSGGGSDPWDQNVVEPIGSVRKQGKSFVLSGWDIVMDVLSPTRIQATIQDTGPVHRWCPADQLPAGYLAK